MPERPQHVPKKPRNDAEIRHHASGTMWSVHKALTYRLLLSCPVEHLIREIPLPILFLAGILHAPRSPHLKKNVFFYFCRDHFPDILGLQMDPPWNPNKKAKIIFQGDFWGAQAPPGSAELQISEKNVECFEREALFFESRSASRPASWRAGWRGPAA